MYQVLLISENRTLLKKVYRMIDDPSLYRIQVVAFSMDAYDAFYEIHADIVVLDTSVFLPYAHILEQFEQCNWDFFVVLIAATKMIAPKALQNCFCIQESDLSHELFQELQEAYTSQNPGCFDNHRSVTFTWDRNYTINFSADAYHLFLLKSYDQNPSLFFITIRTLIQYTSSLCELHCISQTDNMALFYINRSSVKENFHFSKLAELIFQSIGPQTALLYMSHVNWKNLDIAIPKLISYIPYFYFFRGTYHSCHSLLEKNVLNSTLYLKDQCYLFLSYLLGEDFENAKHILRDLYFQTIKSTQNFCVRNYIRQQIHYFYYFLMQKKFLFAFDSIEDEFEYLVNSPLFDHISFPSKRSKEILTGCILTIYDQFQNPISLEGIADEMKMNKIYLNKLFKTRFQKTILDTLLTLRIQEAIFELLFTDEKISDIALNAGFSEAGYFSKVFKRLTGRSALEFREKNKNSEEKERIYESFMEIS